MMPYAGGEYVYLRGAYGDLPPFSTCGRGSAVAKPASIASVTTGLARVLGFFPPFHGSKEWQSRDAGRSTWSQVFAIAATWLITGLNYLGIKKAGDFQLFFTWLKVVLILIIAGFCFASSGQPAPTSTRLPRRRRRLRGLHGRAHRHPLGLRRLE